ncbi:MAG: triose-phosphate isomerase, partial [Actinobacteria bacterium]|nr:triose-phosphate isomerase [Actinomycetota bacterium]
RILYGGSVNLENARAIIKISDVDGLAVTRGALLPENFIELLKLTENEAISRYKKKLNSSTK